MGRTAEGIPLILHGIATTRAIGTNILAPFILMTLAEVHETAARS
jgi:hypothetical protein